MWAEERRKIILDALGEEARVTSESLALRFGVSKETIRRDFRTLEEQGQLKRTHGGALLASSAAERPFRERVTERMAAKEAIAAQAAALVKPGCCCFIDAGSTTAIFSRILAGVADISVITNSFDVVRELLSAQSTCDIVLLGGTIGQDVPATFGPTTVQQLGSLRADIAFVSPVGIDPAAGVSYFDLQEAEIARIMFQNARKRVVLADASKCGAISRSVIATCREVDVLITDHDDLDTFVDAGVAQALSAFPQR